MSDPYLLALDQGTTSTRAILFDRGGRAAYTAQREFAQHYPGNGLVEHDAGEILQTALAVCGETLEYAARSSLQVAALGITNQRETTVVWERQSGRPVHRAIVWQDRRTAAVCEDIRARGLEADIARRTGLLADPYFSATKIAWILDHVPGARLRAERGELLFGTTDCYLVWHLSGGRVHATDASNASRTLLFDIRAQEWDPLLLERFRVPRAMLPEVRDSAADYGEAVLLRPPGGGRLPIRGVAGDQQAAAIGQACFRPGMIKGTYGTGCFLLMNTGAEAVASGSRLLSTVAYRLGGETCYALEGAIFNAGTAVQWLRDQLGLLRSAGESEALARRARDHSGVYLVPAFTGLGAPHWDAHARGGIFGLTRDSSAADLVRAALEAACYQTLDLVSAMAEFGRPESLRVDGGMAANDWLLQFLADILELPVERPRQIETTALGAAYLAGLQSGVYADLEEIAASQREARRRFTPAMDGELRRRLVGGWAEAVRRVRSDGGGPRAPAD
ncbi:MAG: glycerol kinase GlpK [Gammaproteobacteria bacterium]|nr:glycerol kinase GlpK [Gammaproteobacteria bacterium]